MFKLVGATLAVAAAMATTSVPVASAQVDKGARVEKTLRAPHALDRRLEASVITESSGLARSTYARDILWTHNDGGDAARLFAVGAGGGLRATVRLANVTQVDFEDVASGPRRGLWVGDIGDTARRRPAVQAYRITEPRTLTDQKVSATRFNLRYPDGPRNAESLLVHPVTERVYVVSREAGQGSVYRAPATLSTTTTNTMTKVGKVPAEISGGTFSPDGSRMVFTNSTKIFVYTDLASAPVVLAKPPLERGESVEVSRDGRYILVGREGFNSPVYRIPMPAVPTPAPPAPPVVEEPVVKPPVAEPPVVQEPVVTPPAPPSEPVTERPVTNPVSDTRPGTRDPLLWPYPSRSIWNHPLGSDARMVPLGVTPPTTKTLALEEDLLFITPKAPTRPILEHSAGWNSKLSRCGSLTGKTLHTGVPIPGGWTTDPGFIGTTPNHSAAIVMPDMSLYETQPLHICPDGKVVSQYAAARWRGNSILTGGMPGNIGEGSHGGSFLTAFGGTIRLGEWVPGGEIPHVMKIELDSTKYLWGGDGDKFRWPARVADANSAHYGGTVRASRMGALLALPSTFQVDSLSSAPARMLAEAMQRYGAYVVDETGRSTVAFATEWGPQGRVSTEFQKAWGFPLEGHITRASGAQLTFLKDMEKIYAAMAVVDDNAADNVGGAGSRMAPWAAPLQ